MLAKNVIKNYDNIYVVLKDGRKYKLKEYFPIVMEVKGKPKLIYLDTGGMMSEKIDFFTAKIENNELIREFDNGQWKKYANLEIKKIREHSILKWRV